MYGFDFSAIKRLAMQEPLVDVVDQEQVVTEPCKLSTFNISDMTKSDAAFSVSPHKRQSSALAGPTPEPLSFTARAAQQLWFRPQQGLTSERTLSTGFPLW